MMEFLDFELMVGNRSGADFPLSVLSSPGGEAKAPMQFPFDELALTNRLQGIQLALLSSGTGRKRIVPAEEQLVQGFGRDLFDALFVGEIRSRWDVSRSEAAQVAKGLRLKMRFEAAELAALPWEFLYDSRSAEYLCLSQATPLVRYLELAEPMEALPVEPPLRILGMVVSPRDLPVLDVERERQRVEEATADLCARGLIELRWLEGPTWRHLQHALRRESWHVFHFVGHGGFDEQRAEGIVALQNDDGSTDLMGATELGRLLGDHQPLRLALLNACSGAHSDTKDVFSSTAATLVRRGTPAVVAMQYEITDLAAIELARSFYEAVADGLPVDSALSEARKAVSLGLRGSLEWGTPALFSRASDGALFTIDPTRARAAPPGIPSPPPAGAPAEVVAPPISSPSPPEAKVAAAAPPVPPPQAPVEVVAPAVPPSPPPEAPAKTTDAAARKRRIVVAGVAGVVVMALIGGLALIGGEDDGADAPGTTLTATGIDTATIKVGSSPDGVAVDAGSAWVANSTDGTVHRIDTDLDAVSALVDVREQAEIAGSESAGVKSQLESVAIGGGSVWVANRSRRVVVRIDPERATVESMVTLADLPRGLVFVEDPDGGSSLWVTSNLRDVYRIDPANPEQPLAIPVGGESFGIAVGEGLVWVGVRTGIVAGIDPTSNTVTEEFDVGGQPDGIAVGAGSIWVTNKENGDLTRIDLADDSIESISLGGRPRGVVFFEGSVWVTNHDANTVARVDPATNRVTTFAVGAGPDEIAAGEGSVWVSNSDAGTVTRITTG